MASVKGDFLLQKMMDNPRFSITESLQKERQIVVDPLSLKGSPIKQGYLETTTPMLPTIITTSSSPIRLCPPPLQPPKLRFLSLSLPTSADSSPMFASPVSNKNSKAGGIPEPQYQVLQEVHLGKSKSYGEARACATIEELDHWLTKLSAKEHDKWQWHQGSFTKTEAVKESPKSVKNMKTPHGGFKCSRLCLYIPSLVGKVKLAKTRKEEDAAVSRTVSLEKFECGSWASAAIYHENIDGDSNNSYFDLPLEMIHYSASEAYSPIAATFVYEKEPKGVLKNSPSKANARKSSRHVRFSTSSSPSSPAASPAFCISPRLRKAREDFNSFLAAQSA